MHVELWRGIVAMALATYLSRALALALVPGLRLPAWALRAVRFVPVGVLAALIWPHMLAASGGPAPGRPAFPVAWPEVLAAFVTALVAFRARGVLLPVFAGVGTVAALRALAG